MKVKDIMTRQVVCVRPEDSLLRAASLMSKHKVSGLPVVEREPFEKLVGIVTQFDLMKKWLSIHIPSLVSSLAESGTQERGQGDVEHYNEVKVKEVMTKAVITVSEEDNIKKATSLLIEHDINPLPVLNSASELKGIISRSDIVSAVNRSALV